MRFITAASVLLSLLMASEGKELLNRQASCDTYVVSNMTGGFRTRTFIDFSNAQEGDNTQQFLVANNFYTSNWDVYIDPGPLTHTFTPNNVKLGNGALELKVSAHPGGNAKVVSAEIGTTYSFKYGSVRTYLKSSTTPGVCEGNFLYANRYNEVDWEILTSTIDTDAPCVPKGIWATNQALVEGGQKTSDIVPFTFDPRADFHEYRIDWSADATRFYIDGQFKTMLTDNVPEIAGPWLWNAWSNGQECWSQGPPTADSVTRIRSIEIFRDFVEVPTGTVCNV